MSPFFLAGVSGLKPGLVIASRRDLTVFLKNEELVVAGLSGGGRQTLWGDGMSGKGNKTKGAKALADFFIWVVEHP